MITLDQILALPRCSDYPESRVRELAGDRTEWTARELAAAPIPIADRFWLLINLLDARRQRLFAADCATRALTREREAGREPDPRSWRAIDVTRLYADGQATDEELLAARTAAEAAARDAAWAAAAWAAAEAAAWAAAWDAAAAWEAAARDAAAAEAAAWAAARDAWAAAARAAAEAAAARAAAREWQLARLVEYYDDNLAAI